jgi:CRISPR system Cascade subunit CasE
MYFSNITFNANTFSESVIKEVCQNKYFAKHQLLWKLFKDGNREFIFRANEDKFLNFYVLSKDKPNQFDNISVETKEYDPQINNGDNLNFQIKVNPTIKSGNKKHNIFIHSRKNKIEMSDPEILKSWFDKKLDGAALVVDELDFSGYQKEYIGKKDIQFDVCDVKGKIKVIDVEKFKPYLFNGIGQEKAFGCGLLLVKK